MVLSSLKIFKHRPLRSGGFEKPKCGWLTIYLSVYLIQISVKTVVDMLTTEKFNFAFAICTLIISTGVCKATVFLFLTGIALYKASIFPEAWGFFFLLHIPKVFSRTLSKKEKKQRKV